MQFYRKSYKNKTYQTLASPCCFLLVDVCSKPNRVHNASFVERESEYLLHWIVAGI